MVETTDVFKVGFGEAPVFGSVQELILNDHLVEGGAGLRDIKFLCQGSGDPDPGCLCVGQVLVDGW